MYCQFLVCLLAFNPRSSCDSHSVNKCVYLKENKRYEHTSVFVLTVCPVSLLPVVGNASRPEVTDPLPVGTVVPYICITGNIPSPRSNMSFTCNGLGEWTGSATCLPGKYQCLFFDISYKHFSTCLSFSAANTHCIKKLRKRFCVVITCIPP